MSEWMRFDKGKVEKFRVLPAGRNVCLMCDKRSREGEVIKLSDRFKVRLCSGCQKEYERGIEVWKARVMLKK